MSEIIDLESLNTMTPEQLDALMENLEPTEDGGFNLKDEAKADPKPAEAAATTAAQKPAEDKPQDKATVEPTATTAAESEPARDEKGKFIATKNGEGKIPYGVLEAARAEAKQYREQLQQKDTAYTEAMRKLELMQGQLTTAGMQPADLPENIQFDDKEIQAIADDFPEVGKIMRGMAAKIQHLQSQYQASQPAAAPADTGNPVMDAINAIPDLAEWREKDTDKFSFAVHLDGKLQNDPAWKDKTLTERFQEVANRVNAAYGVAPAPAKTTEPSTEELQKKAAEKLKQAKAEAEIPASPSDLGNANITTERTVLDKAVEASPAELQAMMDKMSPKELESFLSQTFYSRE